MEKRSSFSRHFESGKNSTQSSISVTRHLRCNRFIEQKAGPICGAKVVPSATNRWPRNIPRRRFLALAASTAGRASAVPTQCSKREKLCPFRFGGCDGEARWAVLRQAKLVPNYSQFVLNYSQFAAESMLGVIDLEPVLEDQFCFLGGSPQFRMPIDVAGSQDGTGQAL